jgi:hypothetical protein
MKNTSNVYKTLANLQYQKQVEMATNVIEEQTTMNTDTYFISLGDVVRIPKVDNDRLPYWGHPIMVGEHVYVDTRAFLNGSNVVKNSVEHNLSLERAVLEYTWVKEPSVFEGTLASQSMVFAEWVAGGICSRFNASEVDRSKFAVVLVYYYCYLVYSQIAKVGGRGMDYDAVKLTVLRTLVRNAGLPPQYVDGVFNDLNEYFINASNMTLSNVASEMGAISSIEMGRFDYQTIMQLLGGGSWIGANATLLSITALEYPPLFVAILKNCMAISSYKNKTRIGRAANGIGRKVNVDTIITTVNGIMSDVIPQDSLKQIGVKFR